MFMGFVKGSPLTKGRDPDESNDNNTSEAQNQEEGSEEQSSNAWEGTMVGKDCNS